MDVIVVLRQMPSGASIVFGVYKTQKAASAAIRLFLRGNFPNADCSICDFVEQRMKVEK